MKNALLFPERKTTVQIEEIRGGGVIYEDGATALMIKSKYCLKNNSGHMTWDLREISYKYCKAFEKT